MASKTLNKLSLNFSFKTRLHNFQLRCTFQDTYFESRNSSHVTLYPPHTQCPLHHSFGLGYFWEAFQASYIQATFAVVCYPLINRPRPAPPPAVRLQDSLPSHRSKKGRRVTGVLYRVYTNSRSKGNVCRGGLKIV